MTGDCLSSLAELDYDNFQVVVVDNGSNDHSAERLRERFPWATIIELPRNIGYSAGNNVGINHALSQGFDFVFLLNNDTVVSPKMLSQVVVQLESKSSIGMAGPLIVYFDQPDLIWSAGAEINWKNGTTRRKLADQPSTVVSANAPSYVEFLSSCAICIRRQVLEEIGLLDERLFIYYDEVDWSIRAAAAGWQSLLVPQATIQHRVSATMGTTSPATEYYMCRNGLLFLSKHLTAWKRVSALTRAVMRDILAITAYTFKSRGGQRIANRDARSYAIRDALLGRWGRMGSDVEHVCYRGR